MMFYKFFTSGDLTGILGGTKIRPMRCLAYSNQGMIQGKSKVRRLVGGFWSGFRVLYCRILDPETQTHIHALRPQKIQQTQCSHKNRRALSRKIVNSPFCRFPNFQFALPCVSRFGKLSKKALHMPWAEQHKSQSQNPSCEKIPDQQLAPPKDLLNNRPIAHTQVTKPVAPCN